jgi:hypothetical protein
MKGTFTIQVVRFRRLDGEGKSDLASCFKTNSRTKNYEFQGLPSECRRS